MANTIPKKEILDAELRDKVETTRALIAKGWSKRRVLIELRKIYNVKWHTPDAWYNQAVTEMLLEAQVEDKFEKLREIQNVRLEELLDKAVNANKIREARDIVDTINKLYGLYEMKHRIEVSNTNISFKFENEIPVDNEENDKNE